MAAASISRAARARRASASSGGPATSTGQGIRETMWAIHTRLFARMVSSTPRGVSVSEPMIGEIQRDASSRVVSISTSATQGSYIRARLRTRWACASKPAGGTKRAGVGSASSTRSSRKVLTSWARWHQPTAYQRPDRKTTP